MASQKQSQKQVWNAIAPEWYEFKTEPSEKTTEFLKTKKGKILDLGCGAGRHLMKINKGRGKMYLVDFSENMIKLAKKKAKKEKIDAEFFVVDIARKKLPFKDNFFDCAIAISVFHCIKGEKNREKAVKELFRVMNKGAEAKISVWNKGNHRFKNKGREIYVKWRDKGLRYYYLFDADEIYSLFKKAGFKIKEKFEPQRNIVFIAEKS